MEQTHNRISAAWHHLRRHARIVGKAVVLFKDTYGCVQKPDVASEAPQRFVKRNTSANAMQTSAKRAKPEEDGIDTLPRGKGLLFPTDGYIATVDGPFDGDVIRSLVKCDVFQMLPCTVGNLAGEFELWFNENGQYEDTLNEVATAKLGAQAFGGKLYGNVLVVRPGTVQ